MASVSWRAATRRSGRGHVPVAGEVGDHRRPAPGGGWPGEAVEGVADVGPAGGRAAGPSGAGVAPARRAAPGMGGPARGGERGDALGAVEHMRPHPVAGRGRRAGRAPRLPPTTRSRLVQRAVPKSVEAERSTTSHVSTSRSAIVSRTWGTCDAGGDVPVDAAGVVAGRRSGGSRRPRCRGPGRGRRGRRGAGRRPAGRGSSSSRRTHLGGSGRGRAVRAVSGCRASCRPRPGARRRRWRRRRAVVGRRRAGGTERAEGSWVG